MSLLIYSTQRNSWEEFYESERRIMTRVFREFDIPFSILDAGCGGLAKALQGKGYDFSYKGIDISEQEIEYARSRKDIIIPSP